MSAKKWKVGPNARAGGMILAAGVLSIRPGMAGSVFLNQAPPVATAPQVVQDDMSNNVMNVFIPAGVVNPDSGGPLQYGPVALHPHASYNFQYATGVANGPGNHQDTISHQLSPGLTANLGRHWTVDYTPTLTFYSGGGFQQTVDQAVSLIGATHYEDWDLGLSQTFSSTSDPSTDTAAQTSQKTYDTSLSAAYAFNDKWVGNLGLSQDINLVSGLQNSYTWSSTEGVNYNFTPRLFGGITVGDGYTKVSGNGNASTNTNPDIVNVYGQLNGGWRATEKISLQAAVGVNDQQYQSAGYSSTLSPIFSAGIQYQPFRVTQVSLNASESSSASDYFVQAQSSDVTSVNLGLSQRILVKYHLNLGVGYSRTQYTTTLSTVNVSLGNARTDDVYTFTASFGGNIFKNGSWAVTYGYNEDQSSLPGFSQQSHQIGFQIGFHY
jgi:hypothetical protein